MCITPLQPHANRIANSSMPEESKEVDPQASAGALGEVVADELNSDQEEALETLNAIDPANPDAVASASTSKKKKSKKKKSRAASSSDGPGGVDPGTSADKLSTAQLKQVLDVNPAQGCDGRYGGE